MKPILNFVLAGALALLALNGALIADTTYRVFLPANQEEADLAQYLKSNPPQAGDLVIARSMLVDDDCAWVPLVSAARVLYCRNVQVLLTPEQNQQTQRFRQALYLYFTGKDDAWVEHVLEDPTNLAELTRLTFLGQVTTDATERQKGVNAVRADLIPLLKEVETQDPGVVAFFAAYPQILVIDNVQKPYFDESRLAKYVSVDKREKSGQLLVLHCVPLRPAPSSE